MKPLIGTSEVDVLLEDSCAYISLDRPQVGNALSASMVDDLDRIFDEAVGAGARLVVFMGRGKHLCTGFDLGGLEACSDGDLLLRFVRVERLLQKIYGSPVATVAVASGRTYGAGADLFVSCDHRISMPGASFNFPGSGFGLVLGTRRLAARIGFDAARKVVLAGHDLSADDAAQLGLVTDICEEAELPGLLKGMSNAASRLSPATVRALHAVTISRDDDADLAALVNSASTPGLRDRIIAYRDGLRTRKSLKSDSSRPSTESH